MRVIVPDSPEERAFQAARTQLEWTIQRAREACDTSALAAALVHVSSLWINRGQREPAQTALDEAIPLRAHLVNKHDELSLLSNMATIHHWEQRWEEAAESYRAAADVAEVLSVPDQLGRILLNLGFVLRAGGSLDDADAAFERAVATFRGAHDLRNETIALHYAGDHDANRGRLDHARERLQIALRHAQNLGAADIEGGVSLTYARVLAASGDAAARATFEAAARIFEALHHGRAEADTHAWLAQHLVSIGDIGAARPHFARAGALYAALPDIRAEALLVEAWNTVDPEHAPKPRVSVRDASEVAGPRQSPPSSYTLTYSSHRELERALSRHGPFIADLARRGILDVRETDRSPSVCESLLTIFQKLRAKGIDATSAALATMERLYAPEKSTQKVNVPFANGATDTQTCTVAARLFILYEQFPAEFARIAEEITGPERAFTIQRTYPDQAQFQARCRFLDGCFKYHVVGPRTLAIRVTPDAHAYERAILEQRHRKYDSDLQENPTRNSRSVIEVLLQSAFTNLALRGRYDSRTDSDRDGSRGLAPETYGYQCLDHDICHLERNPLTAIDVP